MPFFLYFFLSLTVCLLTATRMLVVVLMVVLVRQDLLWLQQ